MTDREFYFHFFLVSAVLLFVSVLYTQGGLVTVIVVATLIDAALRWIENMQLRQSDAEPGTGK